MFSSFMIAADKSGSGKTTLTTGIIRYLTRTGRTVAPFKCGPDYIDTLHLERASGRKAYNLDSVMLSRSTVADVFTKGCAGADAAVIEGVMGILDGVSHTDFAGSSADVASIIDVPCVLVLDCSGSSYTAAAMARGISELAKVRIAGVVLNNIASDRHAFLVRSAVETHTDCKVLGTLPKNSEKLLGSRHLGIKTAMEVDGEYLDACADFASANVNIEDLLKLCRMAEAAAYPAALSEKRDKTAYVAYDKAFQFYYNSNIDFLRSAGFDVRFFSPLAGEGIDGADFVYIGGGYPELYAKQLSESPTAKIIKDYAESGGKLYAECGGLMFLSGGIHTSDGFFPMAGVFDCVTRMCDRRQALGYVRAELLKDCILGRAGESNIGHEFHYSAMESYSGEYAYRLTRVTDGKTSLDGLIYKNTAAAYTHLHFLCDNPLIKNLII
ncbi:cobyrinate a,c-diamide synthase [Seleniivibrio woodruffii]|uniref:Cobyrinate a,c-diamide synthase n=1 Tax=Seleniivibrio woodruffii TaxID=1078050 RepID=A0A4V2PS25_9BACT|nr:cobyrinate a,c-diamide synthase [Seleniivibrio woodruffii]TCK61041.1 cobyrinic acid a,c-diamide synthase [Seleniivibrio woodruffii]TVZ36669.1 cobyrinic acid a,c-diamide synthase [Seleniivibrio woodruffii]